VAIPGVGPLRHGHLPERVFRTVFTLLGGFFLALVPCHSFPSAARAATRWRTFQGLGATP